MNEITCETQGHLWGAGEMPMIYTGWLKLPDEIEMSGNWVHLDDYQRMQERAVAAEIRLRILEGSPVKTIAGPTPHGVVYDKPGWLCSVCGFWNNIRDDHCAGIHLQGDGSSPKISGFPS